MTFINLYNVNLFFGFKRTSTMVLFLSNKLYTLKALKYSVDKGPVRYHWYNDEHCSTHQQTVG